MNARCVWGETGSPHGGRAANAPRRSVRHGAWKAAPVICALLLLAACSAGDGRRRADATQYGLGHAAPAESVAREAVAIAPDGAGLPAGSGTAAAGATLFAQQCAVCHGAKGEGLAPFPKLIGREPREGFPFGRDARLARTVGNYWPYPTTVFDYIRRAMPYTAPGSLSADQVYSLTAYLLAANEIITTDAVMDARTLPLVRMPARDRFVRDDRRGGPEVR